MVVAIAIAVVFDQIQNSKILHIIVTQVVVHHYIWLQKMHEMPSLRDLNRYVVHKFASEWEDIATELGLDKEIAIIEKDNRRSIDCLKKTLLKWLDSTPCNWKMLEVAITNVKRAQVSLYPITDVYGKNTSS